MISERDWEKHVGRTRSKRRERRRESKRSFGRSRPTLIPEILMAPSSRSNFNKLATAAPAPPSLPLLRRLRGIDFRLYFRLYPAFRVENTYKGGTVVVFKRERVDESVNGRGEGGGGGEEDKGVVCNR